LMCDMTSASDFSRLKMWNEGIVDFFLVSFFCVVCRKRRLLLSLTIPLWRFEKDMISGSESYWQVCFNFLLGLSPGFFAH